MVSWNFNHDSEIWGPSIHCQSKKPLKLERHIHVWCTSFFIHLHPVINMCSGIFFAFRFSDASRHFHCQKKKDWWAFENDPVRTVWGWFTFLSSQSKKSKPGTFIQGGRYFYCIKHKMCTKTFMMLIVITCMCRATFLTSPEVTEVKL